MTVERVWAAALGLTMLFAVSTVWTKDSVARHHVALAPPPAHTATVIDSRAPSFPELPDVDDEDWTEPRVDLNGNDIETAVSDYRVDTRGEMYERHAPDTALLHLSSPEL